jgi:excisionase family DNA binding protein
MMNDKFLNYAEAIKFLKLSRGTIDRYIARKAIPNYKVGRLRLFDRDELIEWVKSHRSDKPKKSIGIKS